MRAAVVFGLDSSEKDLGAFRKNSDVEWLIGLPANSADADAVLIFGGDGTIHRHLARLVELRLPLLIVPCGSGNDFARALHLSNKKAALSAWKEFVAAGRNVRCIDLGVITPVSSTTAPGHYFCCVGGVGLDAEVARRANQLPCWMRSHGGYLLGLVGSLFRFAPLRMRLSVCAGVGPENMITRGECRIVLAAFANAPTYGDGMKIAPRAKLDDGKLDVCLVHDIDRFRLFCLFPTVYFGQHLKLEDVEYLQTSRLKIETEAPVDVYADGEYVCQTPIEVGVAPKALRVIV